MTQTFYDNDRNGAERILTAHFDFEPEEEDTREVQGTGASVRISRVELAFKNMKRNDVMKFISSEEIEKMEQEILETII